MASNFPIQYYTAVENGPMNLYFVPAPAATFKQAALLVQTTGAGTVDECGADPALILGISKATAADKWLYGEFGVGTGRVPVSVLTPAVMIGLCVTGTLALANEGIDYGVTKNASGNWSCDVSKTGAAARFHVVRADVTNQIAWGYFLATNLQADAIAS